ncbi:MAG TPA: type II secretion system inner membrane protein GspF [Planctomycetota bacterium]|nr:type II secretion system inner membrane protein GspF [Planctomycetota bacterium]
MPIFEYKALTQAGQMKKGIIDADTARVARDKLRVDRVHVTEMRELIEKHEKGRGTKTSRREQYTFKLPTLQRKVKTRDLATFTRQFSTLLKSGIQLADALKALVDQAPDRNFEQVLRIVKEEITSGNNLAEALAKHPLYFSDLYVNMVRAGEASGNLDVVLTRVANYLQKQATLKGKVVSAITYPCIMVTVGTAVVIFLMSYVVPKITQVLKDRGRPLPFVTEVLMSFSTFMQNFWWVLFIGIAALYFLFKAAIATDTGRLRFHSFLLKMPIFGPLFSKQAISRFTMTFSTLLKSGLPALDALKIVSLVVNNAKLTQVINDIHTRIIEGADIATPIKKSKVFPPMIGYMVAVGEQSGQLEEVLDRISESYEEELDYTIQRLTAMIEPMIIILLAVVVGFIIAAVLLPLLDFQGV